jgi:hypothetical protein
MRRNGTARARGSALITVILVVLVLTIVGLGVAFFTSTEDKISGNTKTSRIGFYAAEAGLRDGEVAVSRWAQNNNGSAGDLLGAPVAPYNVPFPAGDVYNPPGGGRPARLLRVGARVFKNIIIPSDIGDDRMRAMYSVFIRNNLEDTLGGNYDDKDKKVNIVVVGQMVLVDASGNPVLRDGAPTVGITKILEEQLQTIAEGQASATQKGANVGGTSAGAK